MERLWRAGDLAAVPLLAVVVAWLLATGYQSDAWTYWWAAHLPDNLYAADGWNYGRLSYPYPPPFAQALSLVAWVPFPAFYAAWLVGLVLALVWLVGPLVAVLLLLPPEPFRHEVQAGGITIFMAVTIVRGWWAFPILTKLTPVIGLIWYAVRREWRPLALNAAAMLAIVAVSVALAPDLWSRWVGFMAATYGQPAPEWAIVELPLVPRVILAAGLVAVAAWRGWRWLLVLAVAVSLPGFGYHFLALTLLAAVPRLVDGVEAKGGCVSSVDPEAGGVYPHEQRVLS